MNTKPISIRDLNVKNVTFTVSPSKVKNRGPSISLKYNGQNLAIRLPRVSLPGGVMVRDGEDGKTAYTLMASLKGCDPYGKERSSGTDELSLFYNFLLDLEDLIIAWAVENSGTLFGKKKSEEVVRDNFKRIIGLSQDKLDTGEYVPNGKYPPSFRMKVPVYDNKVSMNIWDESFNEMYATPESLVSIFTKGVESKTVVSGSVYVINGTSFGVTWRLQSAQVYPRARMTAHDIFGEDEEDTDALLADQSQTVVEESQSNPGQALQSEDAPPNPPPAPRKRRAAVTSSM